MAYFRVRPWYKQGGGYLDDDKIYGVTWDGSESTSWTRTDDAVGFSDPSPAVANGTGSSPFDKIMPWAGMEKVEDANAGTLVAIPKFYFKLEYADPSASVKGLKLQISRQQFTGSQVSPAHMDRGDGAGERDVVYVGRFACSDSYTSESGVIPKSSSSRGTYRTGIHNLGSDIWQWDYAMLLTIQFLYLVEFANWNAQVIIGRSCGGGSKENTGATNAMRYHTGTAKATAATRGAGVQYRNIEDIWGNVRQYIDGVRFSYSDIYVYKKPSEFSDTSGGSYMGSRPTSGASRISAYRIVTSSGYTWLMLPSATVTKTDVYTNCEYGYDQYNKLLSTYGSYDDYSITCGLFGFYSVYDYGNAYTGSRLMKLP